MLAILADAPVFELLAVGSLTGDEAMPISHDLHDVSEGQVVVDVVVDDDISPVVPVFRHLGGRWGYSNPLWMVYYSMNCCVFCDVLDLMTRKC